LLIQKYNNKTKEEKICNQWWWSFIKCGGEKRLSSLQWSV